MIISVIADIINGKISKTTFEAITAANDLKKKNCMEVQLVVIHQEPSSCMELIGIKVDSVVFYKTPKSEEYRAENYLDILRDYYNEYAPKIIIFTGGIRGLEMAPRLAYRIESTAIIDCLKINWEKDNKKLCVTKSIYGGNVNAEFYFESFPCVIGLRAHEYGVSPRDKSSQFKLIEHNIEISETTWIVEKEIMETTGEKLEDAKIVLILGRGVDGKANAEELESMANKLGIVVGGTKKVIDNGWLPLHKLVGQTGNIISPEVCIIVGASGAAPLVNGINSAKCIIAIDKDKDARIFEHAHIGMVEKYQDILPLLEEKVIKEQLKY